MMTIKTPEEVTAAIQKLDSADQVAVQTYIANLKATIADLEVKLHPDATFDDHHDEKDLGLGDSDQWSTPAESNLPPPPPMYDPSSGNDDTEKATSLKMEASDLKSAKDYPAALEKYNAAIVAAPPSALLYANRATVLLELDRPSHAILDCDAALSLNPDSVRALRVRGRAHKSLENWDQARHDLSAAQAIDFDDVVKQDLDEAIAKVQEVAAELVRERNIKEEEEKKRQLEEAKKRAVKKKMEEDKKREAAAQAQRQRSANPFAGGMGGLGGLGGLGGMANIAQTLMSDPELAEGLKNPKIMAAFADLMKSPGGAAGLMSNPAKLQELMSDPDIGPFMKKIVTKLGPAMMGGGMGGAAAASTTAAGNDDMDMPDIPDLNNEDIPNLD